jgi:hypothetical protein
MAPDSSFGRPWQDSTRGEKRFAQQSERANRQGLSLEIRPAGLSFSTRTPLFAGAARFFFGGTLRTSL